MHYIRHHSCCPFIASTLSFTIISISLAYSHFPICPGLVPQGEALFALKQYEEAERAYKKAVDLVSKADGE